MQVSTVMMKKSVQIATLLGLLVLASCASQEKSSDVVNVPYPPVVRQTIPQFNWPVFGGTITRGYKKPKHGPIKNSRRWRRKHLHHGIDVADRKNTPIYAAHSGKVIHVGRDRLGFRGYGKLVIIKSKDRQWKTYYAHLNRFRVKYGQKVNKGQVIGLMGNTGRSRGTHLHFEIRRANQPIDPIDHLPYTPMVTWQYSEPPMWQNEINRATP